MRERVGLAGLPCTQAYRAHGHVGLVVGIHTPEFSVCGGDAVSLGQAGLGDSASHGDRAAEQIKRTRQLMAAIEAAVAREAEP